MAFDEWWQAYWTPTGQPPVFDAALKEIAENAWKAATAAERERWGRVIEGKERDTTLRRETAAEIRRQPSTS